MLKKKKCRPIHNALGQSLWPRQARSHYSRSVNCRIDGPARRVGYARSSVQCRDAGSPGQGVNWLPKIWDWGQKNRYLAYVEQVIFDLDPRDEKWFMHARLHLWLLLPAPAPSQVWCDWQVTLCDPHLSTLEVRFSRRCAIQIDLYLCLRSVRRSLTGWQHWCSTLFATRVM